ncbi:MULTISPECIES: hypothetical protein [unclassified Acinetobacter]|uniref:hypothetical protein n=1 Tax=unclassified Acinetobacter TaxID=196816 RepID=UPI001C23F9E1|nr:MULTISPECIES: hypothetical protein [unclassified Acinetobacter]
MLEERLIIESSLILAKHYLDAEGAIFYKVDEHNQDALINSNINIPKQFVDKYNGILQAYDPLNVEYFLKSHDSTNLLSRSLQTKPKSEPYKIFVNQCGINEIMEIVFWKNNHAYAGIALTNPNEHKKQDYSAIQALQHILSTSIFRNR